MGFPFSNILYRLFPSWICDIDKMDLVNIPIGMFDSLKKALCLNHCRGGCSIKQLCFIEATFCSYFTGQTPMICFTVRQKKLNNLCYAIMQWLFVNEWVSASECILRRGVCYYLFLLFLNSQEYTKPILYWYLASLSPQGINYIWYVLHTSTYEKY